MSDARRPCSFASMHWIRRTAPARNLASPLAGIALLLALAAIVLGMACATAPVASPSSQDAGHVVALTLPPEPGPADPGVYDDHIVFGQSAAFSGPAQSLGQGMRLGILAAFREANQAGGVHGRRLELESLDDGYESDAAFANTQRLIYESEVFALIGAVGTPTTRSSFLSADYAGAPFVAPFTGAEFLRNPELDNVLNLRASYYQETEEMVARLTEDLGIERVAVFYQDDAYGETGLEGTRLALERRGLEPVGSGHYERNTTAVHGAVFHIVEADPEAVILIGAYAPVARAVTEIRKEINPVFIAISFVAGEALARELGPEGAGVYVTQVVPFPKDTGIDAVARYRDALVEYDSNAVPGFISLEGYLAGRLAIAGLELCGSVASRECFLDALRNAGPIDIDGVTLQYGPEDNQGSDAVFITMIGNDGDFRQVDRLGNVR